MDCGRMNCTKNQKMTFGTQASADAYWNRNMRLGGTWELGIDSKNSGNETETESPNMDETRKLLITAMSLKE